MPVPASSSALSLSLLLCFPIIFGSLNHFPYLKSSRRSLKRWGWTEPRSSFLARAFLAGPSPCSLKGSLEVSVLPSLPRAPCTCGLTCSQTMSLHRRLSTSSHGCLSGNTHGMGLMAYGGATVHPCAWWDVLQSCTGCAGLVTAALLQLCHWVVSWVHQLGTSELQLISVCEGQG